MAKKGLLDCPGELLRNLSTMLRILAITMIGSNTPSLQAKNQGIHRCLPTSQRLKINHYA